jgi:hypothetical protein
MAGASDTDKKLKAQEFIPSGAAGDDPLTRNLKRVYEEIAAEPIPEGWLKLLDQLDQKGGQE